MPPEYQIPHLSIFMQIECASSQEDLEFKRIIGFMIAVIGIVIVLLFQYFMEHTYTSMKVMTHKLDDAVLTADDFTVTLDLPE